MKHSIWNLATEIIKEQGNAEKSTRSLIGKLIKDHGEYKVAHAIADLSLKNPAEAKSFLIACCKQERVPGVKEEDELLAYAKKNGIKWKKAQSYTQLRKWCLEAR